MKFELEVLSEQLDELLASPIVNEDDALEVAIVAGLAYRLGATPATMAAATEWRDGQGAELLEQTWAEVDLEPLLEAVDQCTAGGCTEEEIEEAVYDVDDVIAAALWCNQRDLIRSAALELSRLIRGIPDVFVPISDIGGLIAATRGVGENLDIYDYWLALADAAQAAENS